MKPAVDTVILTARADALAEAGILLQEGFYIEIETGHSVRETLLNLNFSSSYIEERIKTLFLNFRPVDDSDTAIVNPGDTLSLSGPMPGLVGAVMRAGSPLSPFRSSIKEGTPGTSDLKAGGAIKLKLFNLILKESGIHFLERGIILSCGSLYNFFARRDTVFFEACDSLSLNNSSLPLKHEILEDFKDTDTLVLFRMIITGD